jgi:hypothetical protein
MPDPAKTKSPAEKRKLDEKLDDALEESFPGSDPVSISQPRPEENQQKPISARAGGDDRKTTRSIPIDKLNASNDD